MKKRTLAAVMALTMTLSTAAAFAGETTVVGKPTFSDVKPSAWYYSYMNKLVDKGAINGYPDKTFKPQNTMTNAEFITTIVGATIGKQEKTGKHWASGYMDAARKNEMLIGDEMAADTWNKPVTRQQMAVVIGRTTEKVLKEEALADTEKYRAQLKDYDKLCDYCKPYILQSYGKGIISGYPDGTFGGDKTATRAEVCSMMTRMLEPADRTLAQVADPEEKGKIEEIIDNPEEIFLGSELKDYVISDPKLWDMELGEDEYSKHIIMKDPELSFFLIDGKVVDNFGRYELRDGRYKIEFELIREKENMDGRAPINIKEVDYIASYNLGSTVTLIPNPFKK